LIYLFSFFARENKETRPRCGEPQLTRGRRPLESNKRRGSPIG
jgi:hypothetical protein